MSDLMGCDLEPLKSILTTNLIVKVEVVLIELKLVLIPLLINVLF